MRKLVALVLLAVLPVACGGDGKAPAEDVISDAPELDPDVNVAAGWLTFDVVAEGAQGSRTFYLKNGGRQDLVFSSITVDNDGGAGPFSLGDVTPSSHTVSSLESLAVEVSFAPSARGVSLGWLHLQSNAYNLPDAALRLVGPAASSPPPVGPDLVLVDPAPTVTLQAGEESGQLFVGFYNVGSGSLEIQSVTLENDTAGVFSIASGADPGFLRAGGLLVATITYSPTAPGSHTATLRITSDDPDTPSADVPLAGELL